MKHIFVCSEYQGLEENLILSRKYCRYVLEESLSNNPFAPHLIYPQFLDEKDESERAAGLRLGMNFLHKCDEMWVFVRNGVLSTGMTQEINYAKSYFYGPVFFFDATDINNIIELRHLAFGVGNKANSDIPIQSQLLAPKPFAKTARTALDDVADALKAGTRYEDLQDKIESFLGPMDSVEQDPESDAQWEEEYREGRSG